MKKLLLTIAFSLALAPAALAAESWNVLGQPMSSGLIRQNLEQPFFDNFAERTGVDIKCNYKTMDVTGIKAEEMLRVLKNGMYDIVSVRTYQAARDDTALLGWDLVGMNTDYAQARKVYEAYKDVVAERFETKFNAKFLGAWPFGPQVLFSKVPLNGLADLKGKKVRVGEQSAALFMQKLGAIPVTMNFTEVPQALSKGTVDVANTGASSANSAGWPEVTEYFMPLSLMISFNSYGINLDRWNKLTPEEQRSMQAAFDQLIEEIWVYSEEISDDAFRCNTGEEPCETVKKYSLINIPVTEEDLQLVRDAVAEVSFPSWAELCEKTYPGCGDAWKARLGDMFNVK